ncbi:spore coat protein U domain-containing protein [Acinetobacter sp. Marseille-Q1618]|uniref:spore coat protein U domain-containing protein n=1 Tax=Acinetobacter sp. Marseille-Q1618 TaxID=2697502 RepID=UPI00156F7CE9|nr:spore coat protein U domain-containing protein [Acinetobacter sp. Marseille-Q1618]
MFKSTVLKTLCLSGCVFLHTNLVYAGSGSVNLTSEITLEPACLINQNSTLQGEDISQLGQLDFGEQGSGFTHASAILSNESNNAISILCPEGSLVKVAFNAGLNATQVPPQFAAEYQRAMANGAGEYIAYQIYENNKAGRVLTPEASLEFLGGAEYVFRIYAEAVNLQLLSKGEYSDQITITVNF